MGRVKKPAAPKKAAAKKKKADPVKSAKAKEKAVESNQLKAQRREIFVKAFKELADLGYDLDAITRAMNLIPQNAAVPLSLRNKVREKAIDLTDPAYKGKAPTYRNPSMADIAAIQTLLLMAYDGYDLTELEYNKKGQLTNLVDARKSARARLAGN